MAEPLGVFLVIKQFKPVGIPFRQDTFQCEILAEGAPLKVYMEIPVEYISNKYPEAITPEGMEYLFKRWNTIFPNPEEVKPEDFKPATEPVKTSVEDDFEFNFGETPATKTEDAEWEEESPTTTSDDAWNEDWS